MSDSAEAPPLTFLVASPHLRGSFFGDALILLLEHTEEGAAGLVLTQSTGTPIHELLPDAPDAQGEALLGGPVQPHHPFGKAGDHPEPLQRVQVQVVRAPCSRRSRRLVRSMR